MIKSKKDYRHYLECDRRQSYRTGKNTRLFISDPIWAWQKLYRKLEYFSNCKSSRLYLPYLKLLRFGCRHMQFQLGFQMPLNCIGPGLYVTHAGSIIINENARIGANLRINVGVVIGQNGPPSNVPVIGDNVTIEPGAKIFGKIRLADWIHIGANAVVNKSFEEPGIVIAGVPARKIGRNKFYNDDV